MKRKKKINKYVKLLSIASIFSVLTIFFFFRNISLNKLINEKPTDVVVANISTIEAQIYWKTGKKEINRIYFKKSSDTGLYTESEDFYSYPDHLSNKRLNVAQLGDLEPDTEYSFRIETANKVWENYTFKTKAIAEEIFLPNIITGADNDQSFILVDLQDDKYMLDTQYHGTWAFDSQNKEYTISKYANYISNKQLQSRLLEIIGSPVYAQAGANCKTNIKVSSFRFAPSKQTTLHVINTWIGACELGGYPEACYEDAYCRALKAQVDPALVMTIWGHESGGSNYASNPNVEDFGIHNLSSVPVANFDKQIDHFIKTMLVNASSYISGCSKENPLFSWAAKFWTGGCTSEASLLKGRDYVLGTEEGPGIAGVYKWYTNEELSWPFKTSSGASDCDYSSSYTNTAYNSCTAKGTSTSGGSIPSGGNGSMDYMIITGTGVTPKDRACKDADGCICLYGYSNSNASSTLNAEKGQTCTVDKKVIPTPTTAPATTTPESTTETTTTTPAVPIASSKPSDGVKDYLIVSGTGITSKDRACKDPDGCICLYGYSNSKASSTLTIKDGYTCTVDKKVIITPEKICCYSNNSVSFISSNNCTGAILENISEINCKVINKTISIKKGINFIEAPYIVNIEEVPANTAKSIITYSNSKILAVGLFRNDRWGKIVKSENGNINGEDFNLEPGESYLIVSSEDIDIPVNIVKPNKVFELNKLTGWNLIPSSIFTNTSSNSKSILQNTQYTFINQIALWNDETSIFDYTLRDNSGEVYGNPLSVLNQEGFFIKIPQ